MASPLDSSLPLDLESLDALFQAAAIMDYLEKFKQLTGATEVIPVLAMLKSFLPS
jgi:hypothetical protein